MLSSGSGARGRPARRDADDGLTRGHQPVFDWPGDLSSRRTREARPESTRLDAPASQESAAAPVPARRKPTGNHRTWQRERHEARWRSWLGLLAERRWLAAIAAAVAALAIVGGTFLLLSESSSKLLAGTCTTTGCRHGTARTAGGTQPPAGGPSSAHKAIPRSHPTATHSTARLSASPKPTPTATPSASPTGQSVQVSYAVVRQHPHSFEGQFTIVNKGSTAIDGWELVVVLPNDQIRSVSDALFHTNGDILYIDSPSSQRSIAPGATLTENFTAHGSTTAMTSCTFNGSPC